MKGKESQKSISFGDKCEEEAARPFVLSGEVPLLSPATAVVMLILVFPLFLLGFRLCC